MTTMLDNYELDDILIDIKEHNDLEYSYYGECVVTSNSGVLYIQSVLINNTNMFYSIDYMNEIMRAYKMIHKLYTESRIIIGLGNIHITIGQYSKLDIINIIKAYITNKYDIVDSFENSIRFQDSNIPSVDEIIDYLNSEYFIIDFYWSTYDYIKYSIHDENDLIFFEIEFNHNDIIFNF